MTDIDPRLQVAYLGPAGTYSHSALIKYFGAGQASYPVADIQDVFSRVERGQSEYGLVPVENSSEGSITLTLDHFSQSSATVCGEVMLRIQHMLMAAPGTKADAIDRIVSHQQSLRQCRHWLDAHYPGVRRIAVSSNAEAARMAAAEAGVAAIAGRTAADIYGLEIAAEAIEDSHDNTTRFWIISRDRSARATGRDKTSVIISTRNEPGALLTVLEPLKRFGINLSKLESRPSRREVWSYSFYVDLEGHRDDPPVKAALEEASRHALDIRVLGSYPMAGQVHAEPAPTAADSPLAELKIVIIGLGLIGGSIARALAGRGLNARLHAVGRDTEVLRKARDADVIAGFDTDAAAACADADLVIIAVPGLTVKPVLENIAAAVSPGAVITDAASVKQDIVDAARAVFGTMPSNFVPGHPIAGSERSGFGAARPDLFTGKRVILTPLPETSGEALALVTALWEAVGAEVLRMDVSLHDEVLAATSHLPHLLAYALVDTLARQDEREDIFRYAAGGFRDFTRIASSDPHMWRDIFLTNGRATVDVLDRFTADLAALRQALVDGDGDTLMATFTRAKKARDRFMRIETADRDTAGLTYRVEPGGALHGEFRVAGDKSISHRAIMIGAIADGTTTVDGFLEGEDALATLRAFRALGVNISGPEDGRLSIEGVGLNGLQPPPGPIYLGNSGTSMRLLAGLMAAQPFPSILTGDESLSRRPMQRISRPLAEMGADIRLQEGGVAPIEIHPAPLHAIDYDMPVASAQVKSCLLLASLYVAGTTSVHEPAPCRDHTERMLKAFGYPVSVAGERVSIAGGGSLTACHIDVPADISSAAFFIVGACIAPGSDVTLKHVGINPTRTGVVTILRQMGADIEYVREYRAGDEPVADIRIRYAPLHGIAIPPDQVPLAIDEFPAIFIAAACAEGKTVLTGAEELRVKESDRIQVMADGLAALGVSHRVTADGIEIEGSAMSGGTVDSHGDHRIAMAFAIAALRTAAPVTILGCDNVATSFPGFAGLAVTAGLNLTQRRNS